MITKPTINAIRKHGIHRMHKEWKRKADGKRQFHTALARAFQELVDLDIAGTLLERRNDNEVKLAINVIRPGSFTTFGKHAIKLDGEDDDVVESDDDPPVS